MRGSSQHPLLAHTHIQSSDSLTGFRSSLYQLGSGYLSATRKDEGQTFCKNAEGWGPLSKFRYDFTPCFMDVWISSVAVFGIVFGAGAVWWLVRKRKLGVEMGGGRGWEEVRGRGGVFWGKMGLIIAIGICTLLQIIFQIQKYPDVWLGDFRFWTSVLTILSLGVIFAIQWLEHTRLRNPNGVVLFYWLFLLIAFSVKLRSLISQQIYAEHLPYFVVYCVGYGLSWLEFVLEWLVPKPKSAYAAIGDEDECPIEYATVFSILTFSWMTPMMAYGYKKFLTEDDLWNLAKRDTTKATGEAFSKAWNHELETRKHPSLWMAIFRAFNGPYFRGAVFKICSDSLAFIQPQLTQRTHNKQTPRT